MNVLIACEFTGRVREAFKALGCNAWSCDLLPSKLPGQHIRTDVRYLFKMNWHLIIAFPPCRYLTRANSRNWKHKQHELQEAVQFVKDIYNAPCKQIAIENPPGYLSTHWKRPSQIIQPYYYGHPFTKETCLWLKGLPRLNGFDVVQPSGSWTLINGNTADRSEKRSETFPNIAAEMARQWFPYIKK